MDNSLYGISQNQTVKENTYDNIINNTSSYNSNSSEEDFEDEYTLDDNYKMKRTKGKHSK